MRTTAVVLGAWLALVAWAPPAAGSGGGPEVERRADALAAQLRCPVCQQLSVRDSPSLPARTFRARIHELVEQGRSDQEVRDFFVTRYGEWILLSPPRRGIGLAVWIVPPLLIVAGLLLVAAAVRRWTARAAAVARAGAAHPAAVAAAYARLHEAERDLDVQPGGR